MRTFLLPRELSTATRRKLDAIRRSQGPAHSLVQRAEIILLAADGWPCQAIANTLDVSPSTVRRWCRRFEEQGLKGLGCHGEGHPTDKAAPRHGDSDGSNISNTIECLLRLRSVCDQFKDAELGPSSGNLAQELSALEDVLMDYLAAQRGHRDSVGLLTVAVVGDFNSGKSTFINGLLEKDLCPTGEEPTTSSVTHFIHGDRERIEREEPAGHRQLVEKPEYDSQVRHQKTGDQEPCIFHISVKASVLEHIRLVDTPGFNAPPPNRDDTRVTQEAIKGADALIVLMDICKGNPTKSLLEQLDRLQPDSQAGSRPPMFLLLNKAENLPPTQRREVKSECRTRYGDRFRDVALISARQLKESVDAAPLETLEKATHRIRQALQCRDPFKAVISAQVVPETETDIYRVDINGNVYDVPTSSDGRLASRDQLSKMMRSVSKERHLLLERQFQKKAYQLREKWQHTLAGLDKAIKRESGKSRGTGDGTGDIKSKALDAIENAKSEITRSIREIFVEVIDSIVTNEQRWKEGKIWGGSTFYQVKISLGMGQIVAEGHGHWDHITHMYKTLLSFLKVPTATLSVPTAGNFKRKLKMRCLRILRDFLGSEKEKLEMGEFFEPVRNRNYWRFETKDEDLRDDRFRSKTNDYKSRIDQWILIVSQEALQPQIDQLREAVIQSAERNLSIVQESAEELDKLRQRFDEMKEAAP